MSLFVALILGSCASPPALSADRQVAVPQASSAVMAAEPESAPAPAPEPASATAEAAALPETGVSETALIDVEAVPEPPEMPVPELPVPEVPEAVPPLPPGERILYFYPEPESITVPPAEKNTPSASAPKAVVVPASPAPQSVPKAAAVPAVPAVPAIPAAEPKAEVLPGIWEAESTPIAVPVEKVPPVAPSRTAKLAAGQTLEVWYPGTGWVYLGDSSAQNGLSYETRKLDKTDTLFTFKALKSGNYILDFSRFDLLEDAFSSDSLAVEVSDTVSKRTDRIRAPNYRTSGTLSSITGQVAVPAPAGAAVSGTSVTMTDEPGLATVKSTAAAMGTTAATAVKSAAATSGTTTASAPIDADAALAQAKKSLSANDPAAALEQLDRFFTAAVSNLDEGWFLRGQAFEANGAGRDIRSALAAYETLVAAYPESPRWKEADARIRYIKQFYLRIR